MFGQKHLTLYLHLTHSSNFWDMKAQKVITSLSKEHRSVPFPCYVCIYPLSLLIHPVSDNIHTELKVAMNIKPAL